MPYDPGLDWFVSFHKLDPSTQDKCIYFTQKPNTPRCKWSCDAKDRAEAIALRRQITTMPPEAVSIEMLEDYIQFNCCRMGNAQHRDRIEDAGYLRPLAQRWQGEIRRYASSQRHLTTTVPATDNGIYIRHGYTTTAPSTPGSTRTPNTPLGSPSYYQYGTATGIRSHGAPFTSVASSTYYQDGYATPAPSTPSYGKTVYAVANSPPSSQGSVEIVDISPSLYSQYSSPVSSPAPQPYGYTQRYDLRPREGNSLHQPIPRASLSEFRPHIANPLPSDSISRKIAEALEDRDFETGSLYIFNRASSPGYVKIGWTASSIQRRLEDWSKCGYVPNLLFSVHGIPHAQRVETLTHYELIKQWRRERKCKAEWCQKSHKEWFEIDKEQAKQVLRNWADFMQYAEPYDAAGQLKSQWREIVEKMEREGDMVTATKLLEHYQASLTKKSTVVETTRPVSIHTPKAEEEGLTAYKSTIRHLNAPKEEVVRVDSLVIEEPTLPKNAKLTTGPPVSNTKPDNKAKPQPARTLFSPELSNSSKEAPLLKPLPKPGPSLKTEPVIKTEPFSKTEPLPRTPLLFSADYSTSLTNKPLFEWQSLLKTETPTKFEPLPRKGFSFSTEQHTQSKTLPFQWRPLLNSDPLFKTTTLPRTEFKFSADRPTSSKEPPLFNWQPLLKSNPLFKTESVARDFSFSATQLVKAESLFKSPLPVSVETPSKAEIVIKSEPVDNEVPAASDVTPVKEGLLPEQIPLPPSPLLQPTGLGKDPISLKETNRTTDDGNTKEEDCDRNFSVADTLADSPAGSSGSESAPVSRPITPIGSSLEKHAQNNTDTTKTDSPSSESDTQVPLVTSSSNKALASVRSDSQEQVSTTQHPKTPEDARQVEPNGTLHGCEESTCKEEDETTAAAVITEVELGLTGWDEDETIVENQSPTTFGKGALEIVDEIYNDLYTGKVNGGLKELDELKASESETQPAIEMVSQA